jgi:hypothetical protein
VSSWNCKSQISPVSSFAIIGEAWDAVMMQNFEVIIDHAAYFAIFFSTFLADFNSNA